MLTVATRELFGDLDRSVNAVSSTLFWMLIDIITGGLPQETENMQRIRETILMWLRLAYEIHRKGTETDEGSWSKTQIAIEGLYLQ